MSTNSKSTLIFYVNGIKVEDDSVDPEWTLLRYLREKLLLPGTKLGCAEGGCGACTVMVSKFDYKRQKASHISVNACLAPVCGMHGLAVTTVEGIGSVKNGFHPVQERLAKAHGSQCGFCTPGFVMSMYTLLRNNPKPTMSEIEEYLVGNLCRCTGYRPILEGFRTFTVSQNRNCENTSNCCENGEIRKLNYVEIENCADQENIKNYGCGLKNCCMNGVKTDVDGQFSEDESQLKLEKTSILFDAKKFTPYDPTQDVIFPPELQLNAKTYIEKSLQFIGSRIRYYRPTTFNEILQLKAKYPEAKILTGNTELGVETKFKNCTYPVVIHPLEVKELLVIEIGENHVKIGAGVTLSDIEIAFKKLIDEIEEYKTKVLKAILEILRWFAGRQIRNVACMGGNIMTGSPISDLNPILMAADAVLNFLSVDGSRSIKINENFFLSYRNNAAEPKEVLKSITIPYTEKFEYFMAYKQARRRDDDIAIVNSGMKVKIDKDFKIENINLSFGGMAPITVMAKETMKTLRGRKWSKNVLENAITTLINELKLPPGVPGGMETYRTSLVASFFFKFYLHVQNELNQIDPQRFDPINEPNCIKLYEKADMKCTQFFQNVPADQEKIDPIGQPIPHLSSLKQTTGEATYIDDIPFYKNELQAALVTSTRAHAKIIKIDASLALQTNGVVAFYSASDVPGTNITGIGNDEEVFASERVHFVGEVIGMIVATDRGVAQKAAKQVKIYYEDLPNPIFTIEEAIEAQSFYDGERFVQRGNVKEGFAKSDFILSGESYVGGQEHFYLETNVHLAIPHEENEMEVISSTQNISETQEKTAHALGIAFNLVTCKVKRIGGGFGGKETKSTSFGASVAIAAFKCRRPIRLMVDRDVDMLVTAGRHPFLGRWKVGFKKDAKVLALDVKLYNNAGYSLDLSNAVMNRAISSIDNVYYFENMIIVGKSCRTNLASNTAFRGFGSPQACFIVEDILTKVSECLNVDPNLVRERNFYDSTNAVTPYGQKIPDISNFHSCWKQVNASADYRKLKSQVKEYNSQNRYTKRGISAIPSKYHLAFDFTVLNQSGVLLLVYKDGTVLISHGGMEMGQGIHTKMIQVASKLLKIPMSMIYISESSTDKVPNTSPSAASSTADLNGYAIVAACKEILNRLTPYMENAKYNGWEEWIEAAYFDRVSLAVSGFYKTPDLEIINPKTGKGNPVNYFTYGAAISQVQIDCLTGDHTVLRTDIVMDAGKSMNPAIDIGQIEGAYTQGYGLFTLEQLVYSNQGSLISRGPGAYKIPSVQDVPIEFNISLLRGGKATPRPILSSKALGEPPLFSGAAVFFAIRDAIQNARISYEQEKIAKYEKARISDRDTNITENFPIVLNSAETLTLFSPATAERIRMACKDDITDLISDCKKAAYTPWSLNI